MTGVVTLTLHKLRVVVVTPLGRHLNGALCCTVLYEERLEGLQHHIVIVAGVGIIMGLGIHGDSLVFHIVIAPQHIWHAEVTSSHAVVGGEGVAHKVPSPVFCLRGGIVLQSDGARGGKNIIADSAGWECQLEVETFTAKLWTGGIVVQDKTFSCGDHIATSNFLPVSVVIPISQLIAVGTALSVIAVDRCHEGQGASDVADTNWEGQAKVEPVVLIPVVACDGHGQLVGGDRSGVDQRGTIVIGSVA